MAVTILSKRLFKIDQKENLIPLFKELRGLAKKQNGFISRGTFSSLTDPGEYIAISEWETMALNTDVIVPGLTEIFLYKTTDRISNPPADPRDFKI